MNPTFCSYWLDLAALSLFLGNELLLDFCEEVQKEKLGATGILARTARKRVYQVIRLLRRAPDVQYDDCLPSTGWAVLTQQSPESAVTEGHPWNVFCEPDTTKYSSYVICRTVYNCLQYCRAEEHKCEDWMCNICNTLAGDFVAVLQRTNSLLCEAVHVLGGLRCPKTLEEVE